MPASEKVSITITALKKLLAEILVKDKLSSLNQAEISNQLIPTQSTSTVSNQSIFIAIKGSITDGHKFLSDAIQRGAVCCIVEDEKALGTYPGLVVEDTRKAFAILSAEYFNNPSKELLTFGVTGTNGKSTTAWMISSLLTLLNQPALLIGTIGNFERGKFVKAGDVTTPDAFSIQSFLRDAVDKKLTSVAMEVSSHALDQRRSDKIDFNAGIFTNLTRDHLDYHGSFEEYFLAKRRLFELVEESKKSNKIMIECSLTRMSVLFHCFLIRFMTILMLFLFG